MKKPNRVEKALAAGEIIAKEFAEAHPVNTPCTFYPLKPFKREQAVATKIASEPWVLGSGHVVVKIEGKSGGVSIEHLVFEAGGGDGGKAEETTH